MDCRKCGYDMTTENYDYCPNCGTKVKKHNVLSLLVTILITFIIFMSLERFIIKMAPSISSGVKYGAELYLEAFVTILVLIMVIVFKNTYILKEKRVGFFEGIFIGWPLLLVSFLALIGGISSCFNKDFIFSNFIATIFLFTFVGIYEEILCRGIVQNEFIERYGKSRKQVILSIICSSLIFGGMHITNILAGQDVFSTILQIVQATLLGMILGGVYYRTKNIKINIFLHAFYDFALSISTNNVYWDSRTIAVGKYTFIISIVSTIMICSLNLIAFIIMVRRSRINPLVKIKKPFDKKKEDDKVAYGIIACIIVLIICGRITGVISTKHADALNEESRNTISFDYEKIYKSNYEIVNTSFIKNYNIMFNDYKDILNVELKNNKLYIKKDNNEQLLSEEVLNFTIYEENNKYIIGINKHDKFSYLELTEEDILVLDKLKDKIETYYIPYSKNIGYMIDREANKKNIVLITRNPSLNIMLDGKEFKIIK